MNGNQPTSKHSSQWLVGRVRYRLLISLILLFQLSASPISQVIAETSETPLDRLLASIQVPDELEKDVFITDTIKVSGCEEYPYHNTDQFSGIRRLVKDLKNGLQQGLQCLSGQGPMGPLHPYHQSQASRLIELLTDSQPKSLQCVNDELFAYAMAASPQQQLNDKALVKRLNNSPKLTILLDTYRIGGLLSKKFDRETYQVFFNLKREQITQHLTGKPLRMKGMHRYEKLPELLFHETIHWLGHVHTNLYPDLTFLYETCCFGGSEYIQDDDINADYQARACNILKDDELWTANRYQQMRLWRLKDYDQLKREMRDHYE